MPSERFTREDYGDMPFGRAIFGGWGVIGAMRSVFRRRELAAKGPAATATAPAAVAAAASEASASAATTAAAAASEIAAGTATVVEARAIV